MKRFESINLLVNLFLKHYDEINIENKEELSKVFFVDAVNEFNELKTKCEMWELLMDNK